MEMPDKGYHARVSSWWVSSTALCLSWIVKTSQSVWASRMTRCLHNTRSSASFHTACSTTNTPMTYSYIVTSLSLNKRLRKPWIILKSVSMSSRIGWLQTCCQWTTARLNTCPLYRSLRLGCYTKSMSFALVTTLLLLLLLFAILVCTLIIIWTWTLTHPTSSVHVHIICATSTTSVDIFHQLQRNVSSTPWLRLELTIATRFSITLPPTIYRVYNGCTMRQRGLYCVVQELIAPRHFYANCIGYQSRVGFSTRFYSSATR